MLRLLPPLCWTGLIAYLGGSQWDGAHSSAWIIPLLRALLPAASPEALATLHLVIRKYAHVLEYAVLAGLWRRSLGRAWPALGLAGATAVLDELRQSVSPGRTASFHDALLDCAAAGVVLLVLASLGQRRTTS